MEEVFIDRIIENPNIKIKEKPFRHIVVDDFFKKDFYNHLCVEMKKLLNRGISDTPQRDLFSRLPSPDENIFSLTVDPKLGYPLSFFYSREWDQYISGVFNVASSRDTILALHHHEIGSKTSWTHNDFGMCSFKEDRLENGVNPWYYQCIYRDDSDKQPDTFRRVRAVAIIYYLLNDQNWSESDGGETALYTSADRTDAFKVAPINNRLLAFEVSPFSFHAFLQNKTSERNSIIQWIHQEPKLMFEKYPESKLSVWPKAGES